jgi:hypothetical protein
MLKKLADLNCMLIFGGKTKNRNILEPPQRRLAASELAASPTSRVV